MSLHLLYPYRLYVYNVKETIFFLNNRSVPKLSIVLTVWQWVVCIKLIKNLKYFFILTWTYLFNKFFILFTDNLSEHQTTFFCFKNKFYFHCCFFSCLLLAGVRDHSIRVACIFFQSIAVKNELFSNYIRSIVCLLLSLNFFIVSKNCQPDVMELFETERNTDKSNALYSIPFH